MATLFERLVGTNADEEKLPLHGFRAAINEYKRGNVTAQQAKDALSLTGSQSTDAQKILDAINGAANATEYQQELWDFLALGELGLGTAIYQNETTFWSRFE